MENIERKNRKYDDITTNMLRILEDERKEIIDCSRSLDSRAGMLLAFLIAAFPIYINIIKIETLKTLLHQASFRFTEVIMILIFFMSIIAFLAAFTVLIVVICTRKFRAFDVALFDNFNIIKYEDMNMTVNDGNVWLMGKQKEIIRYNDRVIQKKAKIFEISLWLCLVFVVLMISSILMLLF